MVRIDIRKRALHLAIAAVLLVQVTSAARTEADEISLMTRNVYLGADLTPIIAATSPQQFFQAVTQVLATMTATNFPERADALAKEIAEKRPHLVGLQEVYQTSLDNVTGTPPFSDLLQDLLAALAANGASYYVVGEVQNLSVAIDVPGLGVVRAKDRDVVLARADVAASVVAVPGCRASIDGCNYHVFAPLPSIAGPINNERGFLIVDATIDGQAFRLVNTHLEIPEISPVVQALQTFELVSVLDAITPPSLPIVVLGDINSAPTDGDVITPIGVIGSPYRQLVRAGYQDTWTLRPGKSPGLTCCQAGDLLNTDSQLFKRVDVILARGHLADVHANVVGNDPDQRTSSGLWPSDHAGVVTRLRFGQ